MIEKFDTNLKTIIREIESLKTSDDTNVESNVNNDLCNNCVNIKDNNQSNDRNDGQAEVLSQVMRPTELTDFLDLRRFFLTLDPFLRYDLR